jgi:transketolase
MKVMAPGDLAETRLTTRMAYETTGPCYLRLGRGGEAQVHLRALNFSLGQGIALFPEGEVALLSTGGILKDVVTAREILAGQGISASLHSVPFLKPLDHELIRHISQTSRLMVTIEEHSIIGGLGGVIAEVLGELTGPKPTLLRLGLRDSFSSEVGDQQYLRKTYGLSPEAIAQSVGEALSITEKEARIHVVSH